MSILDSQGTTLSITTGSSGSAVTGLTPAAGNPTIFTKATAHGLSNGDLVTIAAVEGDNADDLNTTWLVENVSSDGLTFSVAHDSTGYTSMGTAATATPLEWATVGTIIDHNINPTRSERDQTKLSDTKRIVKAGLLAEGPWTFNLQWDHDDTGLNAVVAAFEANTATLGFKITYSDDETATIENASVLSYSKGGGIDEDVSGSITVVGVRA
jgi:hypothetical protein